jgi:membrane protease YdiL (CAAX protease family)
MWTASSFALGLVFAWLTLVTGNLGAAVAAHFIINLLNLHYITRGHEPAPEDTGGEVRVGLLRV